MAVLTLAAGSRTGIPFSAKGTAGIPVQSPNTRAQRLTSTRGCYADVLAAKGRYRSESFGNNRSRRRILGDALVMTERPANTQYLSCSIYDPRNPANSY